MKISVPVYGISALKANLGGLSQQIDFAAAKGLTETAHDGRRGIQSALKSGIQGGPTAFTLRAFEVEPATKKKLESAVVLRQDSPEGGTSYHNALAHLFTGGGRQWKKLEGWLRANQLITPGMMIAPGPKIPLDSKGNIRRKNLDEMLGVLSSDLKNLRVFRKSGRGKLFKAIGFFVCHQGDKSGLAPGIWRRIDTGFISSGARGKHSSGTVEPWIMFISPARYRQRFDLHKIVSAATEKTALANFQKAISDALRTAR